MFEIVISSSSNSDNKGIDDYHDTSSRSSSDSSSSRDSSSEGNMTDEQYMFKVPRIPLENFQEELRMRVASAS